MPQLKPDVPSATEIRERLLDTAREFCRVTGMSYSAIGRAALNDHTFLHRVEGGENFNITSYRRITEYFNRNWPRDTVPVAE